MKQKLTPPELARLWGVHPDKIIAWIRSGELKCINAATRPHGRPRYLIDLADIKDFERRRAVVAIEQPATRRKKRAEVPQYV